MSLKIYLHFEGPPQHTKLIKVAFECSYTASGLLRIFADAYRRKYPEVEALQEALLELRSHSGTIYPAESVLSFSPGSETDFAILRSPEGPR